MAQRRAHLCRGFVPLSLSRLFRPCSDYVLRLSLRAGQGEPSSSNKKAVANKKSEIYANLVLFLSKTMHISLNVEILCKNKVGQNHSNLELSFYIMQDSN